MSDAEQVDEKVVRKALQKLVQYEKESRILRKDEEEYRVMEEVFNRPTLFTLYHLLNAGVLKYLNGVVAAGKEARVYWGVTPDEGDVAVKIYLTVTAEFRRRLKYITGDPRFSRVSKDFGKLVELWARKEFRNLQEAFGAQVRVPRPIEVKNNVLVMEFIGTQGRPAPLLAEVPVRPFDYRRTISLVKRLYIEARLVHADLSQFNIFKRNNSLILFDMGSAVEVSHPMASQFLLRDISNINNFFSKHGVKVRPLEEVLSEVTDGEL